MSSFHSGILWHCVVGYFCVLGAWSTTPTDYNNFTSGDCLCPANSTGGICQPGYYCPTGSMEPTVCDEGYYCNTPGKILLLKDAAFFFGIIRSEICWFRIISSLCFWNRLWNAQYFVGLAATAGQCQAGYYCAGRADRADPTDGVTGDICPPGRYCGQFNLKKKEVKPWVQLQQNKNSNRIDIVYAS